MQSNDHSDTEATEEAAATEAGESETPVSVTTLLAIAVSSIKADANMLGDADGAASNVSMQSDSLRDGGGHLSGCPPDSPPKERTPRKSLPSSVVLKAKGPLDLSSIRTVVHHHLVELILTLMAPRCLKFTRQVQRAMIPLFLACHRKNHELSSLRRQGPRSLLLPQATWAAYRSTRPHQCIYKRKNKYIWDLMACPSLDR